MKIFKLVTVAAILFTLGSAPVLAQDSQDYHPALSDRFLLSAGGFWPDKSLKIRVDGTEPEEEIDFEEDLKLSDREATWAVNGRWRFGEKWSLFGQYWTVSDSGGAALEEDIEWGDVVFKEGTFATTGMDLSVARLFFGRKFGNKPNQEWGLGAGLHWLELDTFLQGQILTSEGDLEFGRQTVSAEVPLPNIGAWYGYSWSPKWLFHARVDWLSASVGDYSGGLWNAQAGVDWSIWRHFGVSLYYNFFQLDVDIDKSDWRGKAESTLHGPFLAISTSW